MTARPAARAVEIQHQIERALLWLRPDGGQARARRNAWAAMVADSRRRHDRAIIKRQLPPAAAASPAGTVNAGGKVVQV